MGIAEKNNAQPYQHNGLTPSAVLIVKFNCFEIGVISERD